MTDEKGELSWGSPFSFCADGEALSAWVVGSADFGLEGQI